jgi:glutaredoxin
MLGRTTKRDRKILHHRRIGAERLVSTHSGKLMNFARSHNSPGRTADATLVAMTQPTSRRVELLTRDGCSICAQVYARLAELAGELGFELSTTDVDAAARAGNPGLRAEFGDRLPVILLDGREHGYWDVDEPRLRADLAR